MLPVGKVDARTTTAPRGLAQRLRNIPTVSVYILITHAQFARLRPPARQNSKFPGEEALIQYKTCNIDGKKTNK